MCYVFTLIAAELSTDELKTLCLLQWGGAKVVSRQASGAYILRKGKFFFEATPETIAKLLPLIGWLGELPTAPVSLERIPGIIAQYEERTAKLKADVPVLQNIVAKQCGKEDELKQMKSDLVALDRKISAELKPSDAEETARAKVVTPDKRKLRPLDTPERTQSPKVKKTMVAEPVETYRPTTIVSQPLSHRAALSLQTQSFPPRQLLLQ